MCVGVESGSLQVSGVTRLCVNFNSNCRKPGKEEQQNKKQHGVIKGPTSSIAEPKLTTLSPHRPNPAKKAPSASSWLGWYEKIDFYSSLGFSTHENVKFYPITTKNPCHLKP